MNDFELMQYWRAVPHPQKEVEQRVLTFGHAVYQQAYKEAREELKHSFYSGMSRGHDDCKPALQKALAALDSAYYILKIQPVTPEQEAETIAIAIQSVTETLEKLG
jgi:hypothetical protein